HNDEKLHNHGSSTVQHGRGSVLTVDLTNRCNMMCDPCFMDANQVGFVHELSWEDIKQVLDNAITIKPKRQMSVQFSGGEPTMSPFFLDAVRYARKVGYNSVQAATNGIEFAKSPEFAKAAAEAGLRYAYLQFDGIGNAANAHRRVGNLFDVKLRAIENLYSAGVDIVPVTAFLKAEQLAKDVAQVTDAGRGKFLSVVGMALAVMRNYDPFRAPTHFKLADLLKKFDKTFGATKKAQSGGYGKVEGDRTSADIVKRRAERWHFLFIAGMWFQDLCNYDVRRTEMCIIPYATQQVEISFCAYNTGIGWRNIIEKM